MLATSNATDESAAPSARAERLLRLLRTERLPLYALLDAARDPGVLRLLRGSGAEHQSLYEGLEGETLADYAPYLASLPADCPAREPLAREGWGESWGVYLTCPLPFAEVRRHFRHFLLVRDEAGEELYFRFYDPRVLRVFLPTCTSAELATFFGPAHHFIVEDDPPEKLVRFGLEGGRLRAEAVQL